MKRAIALARRGAGRVSPNPLVGAVVVRDGQIVGEGYHLYERRDHAEIVALRKAGSQAKGAALYINLEPCSHQGRTPPCVDAVIEAGIREVYIGTRDPDRRVNGQGIAKLQAHRILVKEGLLQDEASRLNEKYIHFVRTGQPFVLLKLAMSLDGKIAARSGDSQWITGERARQEGHRLRYEYDAILAGIGTVLQDDPALDVRWRRRNRITKVVMDSTLQMPAQARLFESGDPVLIFHATHASPERAESLRSRAQLIAVPESGGSLDWQRVLKCLGEKKVGSLIIEGGSRIAASALRSGVVQKVAFFYGPILIGSSGLPGLADLGVETLKETICLRDMRVKRLGNDWMLEGYLQ